MVGGRCANGLALLGFEQFGLAEPPASPLAAVVTKHRRDGDEVTDDLAIAALP